MKKSSLIVALLMTAAAILPALGYVPPSDDQIAQILANHAQLNPAIQGASPSEAASVVSRALAGVANSTAPAAAKTQASALLYTRALLLSGENAPQMVRDLAGQIDQKLIPALAAATAIAVGGAQGPVFDALVQAVGAGTDAAKSVAAAAADPASVLGAESVALVQQLVIELRGVAAPVIPPPATAPMNLVPPIVPRGVTTPPVADTYENQ